MTKVVCLTSVHRRYDQRILWRECCSLRKNGYEVTLVVNDTKEDEILDNGIRIISTGIERRNRKHRFTECVNRVYEVGLGENGDIYHLHDPELLRIALKLKKHGKKVIFDSHETYGEALKGRLWIPSLFRPLVSSIYNSYEAYICKRIDGVIHVAKYNGKDWFLNRSKRFAYVGNFPRLEEYEQIEIPPYSERKNVVYSGGIYKTNGILNILKAATKAKTRLLLAGWIRPSEFRQEIIENDVDSIVDFVGMLDRKEIYRTYAKSAIGVALALDTGGQATKLGYFNTKVYEYMAMEMPVVVSDWPFRRQMIEKYRFGLLADPNNPEDIASKISWLMEHPKDAEEMGKNGKRLLKERFTWDKAERELLKLYSEIEKDD